MYKIKNLGSEGGVVILMGAVSNHGIIITEV